MSKFQASDCLHYNVVKFLTINPLTLTAYSLILNRRPYIFNVK